MNFSEISLHIPPQMWHQFRDSMIQARQNNEEVIGFLFCQSHQVSSNKIRYFPKTWVVPKPDCYEHQSTIGLVLKQKFHKYLLETHLAQSDLDIVHIHTHTGREKPCFSNIDDRYESEYAQFLSAHFPQKPRLISGVFDEYLEHSQFRLWDRHGVSHQRIQFYQSWFNLAEEEQKYQSHQTIDIDQEEDDDDYDFEWQKPEPMKGREQTTSMFARQEIFGSCFQQKLSNLSVALIGCGGIGSIFAEILGRLGVKKWLLIDPDRLETVNLNRMVGATATMVEDNYYKVDYVKGLIQQIYPQDACIQTAATAIKSAQTEVAGADLIVVATDNHHSRQLAQELAIKYMRPLICLGTHIDIKADGTPRMYYRVTIPPVGGGWCLMCGNIINLQQAALELAPWEISNLATQAGYLKGVSDPAVFWLNSMCASTAVSVIHSLVGGFINIDSGLDWVYEFPGFNCLKTDVQHLGNPNCYFCGH